MKHPVLNREENDRNDQNVSLCLQVSSYRVGLDIAISFEFRTSKPNGVMLAVSNQASDGLGIEIVQGKVGPGVNSSLTLFNEKRFIDMSKTPISPFTAPLPCGQWGRQGHSAACT